MSRESQWLALSCFTTLAVFTIMYVVCTALL